MTAEQKNKTYGLIAKNCKQYGISVADFNDPDNEAERIVACRGSTCFNIIEKRILSIEQLAEYFDADIKDFKDFLHHYVNTFICKEFEITVTSEPEKPTFVRLLEQEEKELTKKLVAIENLLLMYD